MSDRPLPRVRFDPDEQRALEALGWDPNQRGADVSCPDPALLLAAGDGMLGDASADFMQRHTAACRVCQALSADLESVLSGEPSDEARDRIRARLPIATSGRRRGLAWGLSAAAVLSAAAALFLTVGPPPLPPDVPNPASRFPTGAPPRLPTVFTADPRPPDAADLDLPLRGTTSASANGEEVGARLAAAAALIGDGQAAAALAILDKARPGATGAAADEVAWLTAVAFVQTGAPARARAVLAILCLRPGWRGALACAGLAELDGPASRR